MSKEPGAIQMVIGSLVFVSLASGLGVIAILPVVSVVLGSAAGAPDAATQSILDGLAALGIAPELESLIAVVILVFMLRAALSIVAESVVGFSASDVATDLRLRLIGALMRARLAHFLDYPAGEYANALGAEARRVMRAYIAAGTALAQGLEALVYLAAALFLSWKITLVASAVGLSTAALLQIFVRLTYGAAERQTVLQRNLAGAFSSTLEMIKPLKAMARERNVTLALV